MPTSRSTRPPCRSPRMGGTAADARLAGAGRPRPRRIAPSRPRLLLLNKPYGVLSQFSDGQGRLTLKDFVTVPQVYPAGRLDRDSEGLLLLTDDGRLQARIADPRYKLEKTYWVQVEGSPLPAQIRQLSEGVMLADGLTRPARVRPIDAPALWPRDPPIRVRRHIPTAWLEIIVTEGRNRQVRRMTAAVGLPTLRLVRVAIGPWTLGALLPGQWRELEVVSSGPGIPGGHEPAAPRPQRR